MNILCVGNSFAVDASTYVHQVAKEAGYDINIHVLYIPGCPINRHWKNYLSKEKEYEFYINGEKTPTMYCDIFEGLKYTQYDYITFQQRSGDSGDAGTFFPELSLLMEGIRKYSNGTYLLHKTWSYIKEFFHDKYGHDPLNQDWMDKDIKDAYISASQISGIKYIIPSGEAIRLARLVFGDNLNRDGYHLNERGRLLAGILFVLYFTHAKDIDLSNFVPRGYTYDDVTPGVDKSEIKTLIEIAKNAILNNRGYNLDE
ncbi:MAG: DUF4886 domain-containing protein [Bacilli bacterium]|nr:DUF4886 domain-containing protein [Bacilli bacterium]